MTDPAAEDCAVAASGAPAKATAVSGRRKADRKDASRSAASRAAAWGSLFAGKTGNEGSTIRRTPAAIAATVQNNRSFRGLGLIFGFTRTCPVCTACAPVAPKKRPAPCKGAGQILRQERPRPQRGATMGKPSSGRVTAISPSFKPLEVVASPWGIQVLFMLSYQPCSLPVSEP